MRVPKDGFITQDVTIGTSQWGESFSNFEEYSVDFDENSGVIPGVRGIEISSDSENFVNFDHSTAIGLVDSAVHSIISDQSRERLLVGSKYGITALDPFRGISTSFEFSSGIELYTMERNSVGSIDFLMLGSNLGLHTVILENGLPNMDTLVTHDLGSASVIFRLSSDSFDSGVLIMGKGGVWRTTFSEEGQSLLTSDPIFVESLSSMLGKSNATATSAGHSKIFGRTPILLIGTGNGNGNGNGKGNGNGNICTWCMVGCLDSWMVGWLLCLARR